MGDFWKQNAKTFVTFSIVLFFVVVAILYFVRMQRKPPPGTDVAAAQADVESPRRESRGEAECRRVVEKLFNVPFAKCRPQFLRNAVTSTATADFCLELDCYNPELALAVEYNGRQHYEYVPFFHRNREAFYNQKYRDELKRIKCRENSVTLVEVPYSVPTGSIEAHIVAALTALGKLQKQIKSGKQ